MDSLKEAFGGDHDDEQSSPSAATVAPLGNARHADRDAPPERAEDANLVTGGKHRA